MLGHQDRLGILAQLCHEKGVNPQKGNYATFIRGIICGKMFLSNQTAIQLTKTLTTAYYTDRWEGLLKEINQGAPNCKAGSATKPLSWNPQKPTNTSISDDPPEFTNKQLSQILMRKAKQDTYNGIGRLTTADTTEIKLSLEEAKEIWDQYNPKYDSEIRSGCLLIFWDGKEGMRSQRDLQKTIQKPYVNTKYQGDVVDDTYDESAPQAEEG